MNLQETLETAGHDCRSYSGRGMLGKRCLAVTLNDTNDLGSMFASVLELSQDGVLGDEAAVSLITKAFNGMQTDSMGQGIIVYFPSVAFIGDEEEN